MAGMHDVAGTDGNIKYKVIQVREREFLITVMNGYRVETDVYNCEYPTSFGLDMVDHYNLNKKLDELIEKVKL